MCFPKKMFPELKNDRIIRAARGEPVDSVPVWIMRQAGRYLPEFMELRKKYTFQEMCNKPEVACEITLQPIRRFKLDAAIIFSDILVVPQAMGMEFEMRPGVGPVFLEPLRTPEDLKKLKEVDIGKDLKYVMDAITLTRTKLDGEVPLFGFSGAPWTLMGYMIEGQGSKTLSNAKKWLYLYPEKAEELLEKLELLIIDYLVCQAKAGAQMLQLFDTNVGFLTEASFLKFIRPGYKRIAAKVRGKLGKDCPPLFLFPKDAHLNLPLVRDCGFDVISLDWAVTPEKARELLGDGVTLQGNLDPCALYGDDAQLTELARNMVKRFGKGRYIANLGHGMYPDMSPDKVEVFVNAIHSV